MTKTDPLISIGLPVYNGANYIGEMIDSILEQTFTDFELIITDNDSTDNTAQICRAFAEKDDRVRYFLNEKNIGAAGNYNRCYEHGTGKYFKWCAHDDLLGSNYLEACSNELEARPDIVLAFGPQLEIDSKGNILPDTGDSDDNELSDDPSYRFYFQIAKMKCPGAGIFGLFRRSALEKSTLHRPYYSSDRALLAEIATLGNFSIVDDALFYCRIHETRSVNIGDNLVRSMWISGSSNRFTSAENINLTRHLFEIAGRHKDVVAPWKMRWNVLKYAAHPRQISRYMYDILSVLLPKTAFRIKSKLAVRKRQFET